jgi:hypothetical protein
MTFLQQVVSDLREWLGWDRHRENFVLAPAYAVKRPVVDLTLRMRAVRREGVPCLG